MALIVHIDYKHTQQNFRTPIRISGGTANLKIYFSKNNLEVTYEEFTLRIKYKKSSTESFPLCDPMSWALFTWKQKFNLIMELKQIKGEGGGNGYKSKENVTSSVTYSTTMSSMSATLSGSG